MDRSIWRDQRWGIMVGIIALIAFLFVYENSPASHEPGRSDGLYTWLYARSAVFDHDVNFTNDYAICGDPFGIGIDRGGKGHPDNPYYVGPSFFWIPVLWVTRNLITLPANTPPHIVQGCAGPMTEHAFRIACLLGALTIYVSYRIARRFVGDGSAALSAAIFGMAGTLAAYSTVMPGHSHVYVTFTVSVLLLASLRASEHPNSWIRWALAGLALGLCVLQRPPALIWGLVPAVMAAHSLWANRTRLAAVLGVLTIGGLCGVIPQLLVYKYLFDSYFWTATGRHYMHLAHAHPFLLLFAPHGGLFFTTPIAWLAVAGTWFALKSKAAVPLVLPALFLALFEVYFYSAGVDWDGAGTFGARRLTTLMPLFVLLASFAIDAAGHWLSRSRERTATALGLALSVPFIFVMLGAILSVGRGALGTDSGASQAQLYGVGTSTAWSLVDELGDLSILPAEMVFKARYGLPMNRFRDATENGWYARHFKRMNFVADTLPMADKRLARTALGFEQTAEGMRMVRARAKVVFAAQWPFATDLELNISAERPAHLKIGRGLVFGRVLWFGAFDIPDHKPDFVAKLPIPDGGFDSGINEFVFESDDDEAAAILIRSVRIEDNAVYPPAFPKGPPL